MLYKAYCITTETQLIVFKVLWTGWLSILLPRVGYSVVNILLQVAIKPMLLIQILVHIGVRS